MNDKMERIMKCTVAVLLMVNLVLQSCSLVALHQLRETKLVSLNNLEAYKASQQKKPVYFCGNYYLYHSQDTDRIQVNEDGVVLNLWGSEDNVCSEE